MRTARATNYIEGVRAEVSTCVCKAPNIIIGYAQKLGVVIFFWHTSELMPESQE